MTSNNEDYFCPLCLPSCNDQFIQWPSPDLSPPSFSGVHAQAQSSVILCPLYRITGIFGGHFNLAVWRISLVSPN